MAVKTTLTGLLVYAAMLCYLGAAGASLRRGRRAWRVLYAAGFAAALAAVAHRWWVVRHLPMQNLFEVFLCLGALVYPISLFSRRFLAVGGEPADALVGAIVLFPAGFVFSDAPAHLPPALQSPLFAPHVMAYMLAYIIMAKAAVQAAAVLGGKRPPDADLADPEAATYRMVSFGFPLLTLGLVLGAVWGKLAWGDYWNWDPKELWSLASWLVYLFYLHWRHWFKSRSPRVNSALALAGLATIIITLLWVNLARIFGGLHSYAT